MPVADICRQAGISQATYFKLEEDLCPPPVGKRLVVFGPLGLSQSIPPVVRA
jgi:hypothetical protein